MRLRIERIKRMRILANYPMENLKNLSDEELVQLAEKSGIISIKGERREQKIRILEEVIKEERMAKKLRNYSKKELKDLVNYLGYSGVISEEHGFELKEDYIRQLKSTLESTLEDFKFYKREIKKFSNDEKYAIRKLYDESFVDCTELKQFVEKKTVDDLLDRQIIAYNGFSDNLNLTVSGMYIYNVDRSQFDVLQTPIYKTMTKELPEEFIKSARALAKNEREYAIGIDFERELKQPQQIVAVQGAERFTYHLGKDFEIFGHTHPNRKEPNPSLPDLENMKFGKPEFVVAGLTGKTMIINIEDENRYRKWKNLLRYEKRWVENLNLKDKEVRGHLFDYTGVRAYPYRKGMKIKLINDPKFEKSFPLFSKEGLKKIAERIEITQKGVVREPITDFMPSYKEKEGKKKASSTNPEKFLKSFKDVSPREKKQIQANLDKQLLINTKLLEKYKDPKAFGKGQKRLK